MLPRIKNDTRQIMVSVMLPKPRKQQQELANPPNEKQGYKQGGCFFVLVQNRFSKPRQIGHSVLLRV